MIYTSCLENIKDLSDNFQVILIGNLQSNFPKIDELIPPVEIFNEYIETDNRITFERKFKEYLNDRPVLSVIEQIRMLSNGKHPILIDSDNVDDIHYREIISEYLTQSGYSVMEFDGTEYDKFLGVIHDGIRKIQTDLGDSFNECIDNIREIIKLKIVDSDSKVIFSEILKSGDIGYITRDVIKELNDEGYECVFRNCVKNTYSKHSENDVVLNVNLSDYTKERNYVKQFLQDNTDEILMFTQFSNVLKDKFKPIMIVNYKKDSLKLSDVFKEV